MVRYIASHILETTKKEKGKKEEKKKRKRREKENSKLGIDLFPFSFLLSFFLSSLGSSSATFQVLFMYVRKHGTI